MRYSGHRRKTRAFTLVEMLVVIAIIGVLAAILLPALTRGKQRAQRIQCISNLKEIGTAFQMFAHDHRSNFPMQVPVADGGSEEYVTAGTSINGIFYFSYRHLQTLANELVVPRVLICPADLTRQPALSFSLLQNSNVSFFVNASANYYDSLSPMAGDRNITNNAGATASLVRGPYGLRWTSELHSFKGNVLFTDTHVEQLNNVQMNLPGATVANTVLFLPAVRVPAIFTSPSPFGGSPSPTVAQNNNPPPPPPNLGSPANADPKTPAPAPSQSSMQNNRSSSTTAGHLVTAETIIEANARETNAVVASRDPQPAAAPAANDEDEPPLLWLQGAARTVVAKSSWWLWLLLAFLIAAALYLYWRRKMRARRQRGEP
jgi:prepilin-type N-terminal cleavage/methylation domain-containing protein/prepilin-type processing-associated H-X9-DG protein